MDTTKKHLKEDAVVAVVPQKAYEGNESYIFISYAHKDEIKVFPIISAI